jgi:exonuclease SbcC
MIPIHLRIAGFLSYRDPVEIDFTNFELACITGHNGAGKSSLLDAMTWALFGEARGKSSDIINLNQSVKAAEVALTFSYEENIYRVLRSLPRGKSAVLEFQIKNKDDWKTLSERSLRETQARIEQTLRLDYETFVNASFFLQGQADQFTQHNAGKRKDILSSILGLEIWETYRERAATRRKELERAVDEIDGRVAEIDAELSEEDARKTRLKELEEALRHLASARGAQEKILEEMKRNAASLDEQRNLADALAATLERSRSALSGLEARLAAKEAERAAYADLINRAKEIESSFKNWQEARKALEEWEKIASQFREHEKERAPLLEQIAAEKARLEEEKRSLSIKEEEIARQKSALEDLKTGIEEAQKSLAEAEAKIAQRLELENQRNAAREKQAELQAENKALKLEMDELKARIDRLEAAEGASCPLCGQPLSAAHRASTLEQLQQEGREKGDRFRANKTRAEKLGAQIADYETLISKLVSAEDERLKYSSLVSQLNERMDTLNNLAKEWESAGRKRLAEVAKLLESEEYAVEAKKQLTKLDKELAKLGYDAAAHDQARQKENELRTVEEDYRKLESAREVTKQLEADITALQADITGRASEIREQQEQYDRIASVLSAAEAETPNLEAAERELLRLRETENNARDEMGAARQKVEVLASLRARKSTLIEERAEKQAQITRHKMLERAFGKDGVPALLIEQALPQIEAKANELLDRLSGGQMSVRFVTQAEYKDKKRGDLKETLDIQISDPAGVRNYEMYSGGEAFRVNFAIRLALSEILAQRKGARLQTLIIDEGFGSQDIQGRQRLIEAINLVKGDFAKILVITHLDELKDAFPNRIEVEKTERGSVVRVI